MQRDKDIPPMPDMGYVGHRLIFDITRQCKYKE